MRIETRIETARCGNQTGNVKAPLKDRKDDLHETDPVAVHALMRHEKLPRVLWESSCGPGAIVRVLRAAGHSVIATDLVDYGCPESRSGIDFLMETRAPEGVQGIVGNPPYKLATEFVRKSVALAPYVAMLLRFEFMAGGRKGLLEEYPPAHVYVFANRLPRMHRAGWTGKKATGRTTFAWFVWDATHSGPTGLRRIWWEPAQ